MTTLTEADIERAALEWLSNIGWQTAYGPDLIPHERADHSAVVLHQRIGDSIARLNPQLPDAAIDAALAALTRPAGQNLITHNRDFHRLLLHGVPVEYSTPDGAIRGAQAQVVDFDDPYAIDFLAVNQFTVTENMNRRRADIVLFVNGLPLGIIELKNPVDADADIWDAWNQLQAYKSELPSLFAMNELMIISDGMNARAGTLTAGKEWFKSWDAAADGEGPADANLPRLKVMLEGMCSPERLLPLLRNFVVFEDYGDGKPIKKMAGYHQFYAVQAAVQETLRAAEMRQPHHKIAEGRGHYETGQNPSGEPGDRRIGVVWHTQGAGKSFSMACYAGAIAQHPDMANPTIVALTDRNDLDDQLFGTFARCQDLLRQQPTQADAMGDGKQHTDAPAISGRNAHPVLLRHGRTGTGHATHRDFGRAGDTALYRVGCAAAGHIAGFSI